MADLTSNSMGARARRRGVSPFLAFAVVAAAAFAVLGIALVERETAYEATVAIRVVSTPTIEPITKLSPREIRAALFGLFEARPQDELAKHSPAGAAEAGTEVPAEGEIDGLAVSSTRDRNVCLVAIRSGDADQLAERLGDAARRFVELRNAAAAASVEAELATLRQRTTARGDERDAAARALAELERRREEGQTQNEHGRATPVAPLSGANEPEKASEHVEQPSTRALNPQWVLLRDEVSLLEGRLAELRGRFTEQHPEVRHAATALADRTTQFKATPQHADGEPETSERAAVPAGRAHPDAVAAPHAPSNAPSDVPSLAPPLAPANDERAADSARDLALVQEARDTLAAADGALEQAWKAEQAAAQRQVELAANGPWRFEPAGAVRTVASGATQAPWFLILGASLAAGLAASALARGVAPVIESPEDAVAALGVRVAGIVRTDDPLPPLADDPGVVSARWLTRAGAALLAGVAAIAALAASANGVGVEDVRRDPTLLVSLAHEWLADRLG